MSEDAADDATEDVIENGYRLIGFDIALAIEIARDTERIIDAYQQVFGDTQGRAVLFHMMASAKVMQGRPATMSAIERAHHDGRVDLISDVLHLAGVDVFERVAGLQTASDIETTLMERAHDRPGHTRDTDRNAARDGGDGYTGDGDPVTEF